MEVGLNITIQNVALGTIYTGRGIPQGTPYSSLCCQIVVDHLLGTVVRDWESRNVGISFPRDVLDDIEVPRICLMGFMDDMYMLSTSLSGLSTMGAYVRNTLQERVLLVSCDTEKSNWICLTRYDVRRQHLKVEMAKGPQNRAPASEAGMVVLGDVLGWVGGSSAAIRSRTRAM